MRGQPAISRGLRQLGFRGLRLAPFSGKLGDVIIYELHPRFRRHCR